MSSRRKRAKRLKFIRRILLLSLIAAIFFISFSIWKIHYKKAQVANTHRAISTADNIKNNKQKLKIKKESASNTLIKPDYIKVDSKITHSINLRKFPYPYSSMLALCSDIDDCTLDNFKMYHQYLNTKEQTAYGEGLGLDVGDSMWLYIADKYSNTDNVMTYYKGIDVNTKHNADEIVHFIKAGWIDSLHTFGDFSTDNERGTSFQRSLAVEGWKTLNSIGFKPKVWINHGNRANTQNFGAGNASSFMSYQHGDDPKSSYYHTDLTIGNGIKYVWNSKNDSTFGYDFPLYTINLRDGKKVWGFRRFTNVNTKGKIDWEWNTNVLYREITQSRLDSIVKGKQYCILAQHLGSGTTDMFKQENLNALGLLKQYQDNNKILIANTTRLLNYALAQKYLNFKVGKENGKTCINILTINDPIFGAITPGIDDLRGITFYTKDPQNTVLAINNKAIGNDLVQVNATDSTGKASIGIKWFAADYTDYTKN